MATRPILLSAIFAAILTGFSTFASFTKAAEEQPQVENAKFQFAGVINTDAVMLRSGPGENYYITTRLAKGTPITVVGIKFDWLKVIPPESSFSVVAKNLVTRDGASNIGHINADNVNIRAGSSVVPLKVTVQCKLPKGSAVEIIKEDDAYYQIKPPADAFLYVNQKFVDPLKQMAAAAPTRAIEKPIEKIEKKTDDSNIELVKTTEKPLDQSATESLANTVVPIEVAKIPPATQPISTQAEFDRLESEFSAMAGKPLDQQPIARLLAGYEGVLKDDHLPISIRRVATAKAASLRVKSHAQAELLALRKEQQDTDSKLTAMRTERDEIQQRLADKVIAYTAVGTLQPSTLQVGGSGTLYRLTDPASGRTLCYVRSNDARFGTFLEKFVGIKGELVSEPQLSVKALIATDVASVDPAEVTRKVSAQIIPPSLLTARSAQAGPAVPDAPTKAAQVGPAVPDTSAGAASTGENQ
jgi:uncharacterized protein YgiM (DUF1202 family)